MNAQKFTEDYGCTLQTDPKTKKKYIELPISDLDELAYMHESLLEGISLLTKLEKRYCEQEERQSTTYWLCKILLASYPHQEIYGLSGWLETDKP